jgi:uncharacterized membrane protein YhhN
MRAEWLALTLVFALGDWVAVGAGKNRVRVITKPGVMLALLTGFSLAGGWQRESFWFGLGLVFSLAGDIFLMLPPGAFFAGLSAFLITHICYIIGFSQGARLPGWGALIPLAMIAAADFFTYRRLRRALMVRPKGRWMRFPLHAYQIILSLMLITAMLTLWREDWPRLAGWLVSTGALLFMISDTVLAINRFTAPVRGGRLIVIISYHLGQIALISGVLLNAST